MANTTSTEIIKRLFELKKQQTNKQTNKKKKNKKKNYRSVIFFLFSPYILIILRVLNYILGKQRNMLID